MVAMTASRILNNSDEEDNSYVPYNERPDTYIVPIVFLLILIVGVTGNGILVFTLLRHANMRNVPNTYVLSLALGDSLVIVTCVPFTSILYTMESWPWGLAVCKLSECTKDISIGVSVFTLTALSAERYCAIVNPIDRHIAGLSAKPLTILIASMIWVLACILALPAALFSYVQTVPLQGNHSILICNPFPEEFGKNYQKGMVMFKFLAYYAIPLCVISGFYLGMARHLELSTRNMPGEVPGGSHRFQQIRARRKVGGMVIAFIIIFVVCFLPYHTFMIWFHFWPSSQEDYNDYWHVFRILGFCLSFVNSCVNPIALYFVSGAFRKRFNEYLCCCFMGKSESTYDARKRRKRRKGGGGRGEEGEDDNGVGGARGRRERELAEAGDGKRGSGASRTLRLSFLRNTQAETDGSFYETTFGSTLCKHSQELNSTAFYELANEEGTKPVAS